MLKPKQFLLVGMVAALGATLGIAYATASVLATPTAVQVTIVPGASTMMGAAGAKAFSPNPVNVKVGQTVTWTNQDTVLPGHTVISGTGGTDPAKGKVFDSGITTLILKGKSFSHTFTAAGTIPYFCQIHPNMVGKIIVT
ncbi:MAG TPA: plastocyanin/azurin family copper-binding protein [Candidatus Bathyarchaeia archaeon]|jgi:plastocyanin|nr:plastocyanin/azurin family copper-binding protein [Candidatus Bathyarchaeia archaeon]